MSYLTPTAPRDLTWAHVMGVLLSQANINIIRPTDCHSFPHVDTQGKELAILDWTFPKVEWEWGKDDTPRNFVKLLRHHLRTVHKQSEVGLMEEAWELLVYKERAPPCTYRLLVEWDPQARVLLSRCCSSLCLPDVQLVACRVLLTGTCPFIPGSFTLESLPYRYDRLALTASTSSTSTSRNKQILMKVKEVPNNTSQSKQRLESYISKKSLVGAVEHEVDKTMGREQRDNKENKTRPNQNHDTFEKKIAGGLAQTHSSEKKKNQRGQPPVAPTLDRKNELYVHGVESKHCGNESASRTSVEHSAGATASQPLLPSVPLPTFPQNNSIDRLPPLPMTSTAEPSHQLLFKPVNDKQLSTRIMVPSHITIHEEEAIHVHKRRGNWRKKEEPPRYFEFKLVPSQAVIVVNSHIGFSAEEAEYIALSM